VNEANAPTAPAAPSSGEGAAPGSMLAGLPRCAADHLRHRARRRRLVRPFSNVMAPTPSTMEWCSLNRNAARSPHTPSIQYAS
jgi:hypothetical protein